MGLAEPPVFEELTAEERAANEKLMQESLAKFDQTLSGRKGCEQTVMMLVVVTLSIAVGLVL